MIKWNHIRNTPSYNKTRNHSRNQAAYKRPNAPLHSFFRTDFRAKLSLSESHSNKISKQIGKDQIAVFHINDSKNVIGAGKDRHENLGFGTIGFETLNHIVHHKDFEQVPKILETPYIKAEDSKKSYPPYKYEIEMLKQEQFDPQMKEKILEDNQK